MRLFTMAASVLLATLGCTSGKGPAADGPAGKVIEVSGEVTATRAGDVRSLVADGPVYADDVVATAGDGEVLIELSHNSALLSLVGSASTRIDASVAWRAPKVVRGSVLEVDPDDPTAVAGRATNREAADDPRTAVDRQPEPLNAKQEKLPGRDQASGSEGTGDGFELGTVGGGSGTRKNTGAGVGAGAGGQHGGNGSGSAKKLRKNGGDKDGRGYADKGSATRPDPKTPSDQPKPPPKAKKVTELRAGSATADADEVGTVAALDKLELEPADAKARAAVRGAIRARRRALGACVASRTTTVTVRFQMVLASGGANAVELAGRGLTRKETSCISGILAGIDLGAHAKRKVAATLRMQKL